MIYPLTYKMKPPMAVQASRDILNKLGCVGLWMANERSGLMAYDYSGYKNHAALAGNPTHVIGKFGYGLRVDGTGDYGRVADKTCLKITDAITVLAWIKKNDTRNMGVLSKSGLANDYGDYLLQVQNVPSEKFQFRLNDSVKTINSDRAISVNVWSQIVGTYDRKYLRVYLNGFEDATPAEWDTAIQTSTDDVILGGYYNTSYLLDGDIDHIMLCNRALTAGEIKRLYYRPFYMFDRRASLEVAPVAAVVAARRNTSGFREITGADRLRGLRRNAIY